MDEIIGRLAARDNRAPSDYERDGIRFCGVCHEPKQQLIEFPGGPKLVPVACACEATQLQYEREASAQEKFLTAFRAMESRHSITDGVYAKCTFAGDDRRDP